jgi:hypothetical protein
MGATGLDDCRRRLFAAVAMALGFQQRIDVTVSDYLRLPAQRVCFQSNVERNAVPDA